LGPIFLKVVFTNPDAPDFKTGLPVAKMAPVAIHNSIPHAS